MQSSTNTTITSYTQQISMNNVMYDHMEFDFELCHIPYHGYSCWR